MNTSTSAMHDDICFRSTGALAASIALDCGWYSLLYCSSQMTGSPRISPFPWQSGHDTGLVCSIMKGRALLHVATRCLPGLLGNIQTPVRGIRRLVSHEFTGKPGIDHVCHAQELQDWRQRLNEQVR